MEKRGIQISKYVHAITRSDITITIRCKNNTYNLIITYSNKSYTFDIFMKLKHGEFIHTFCYETRVEYID